VLTSNETSYDLRRATSYQLRRDHFGGLGTATWPHPSALAVLAGYAVVFTVAAARFFRWD